MIGIPRPGMVWHHGSTNDRFYIVDVRLGRSASTGDVYEFDLLILSHPNRKDDAEPMMIYDHSANLRSLEGHVQFIDDASEEEHQLGTRAMLAPDTFKDWADQNG